MIELIPIEKCVSRDLYEMYQDIPKEEIGSRNEIFGLNYDDFVKVCNKYIKEETVMNEKILTTTNRYILSVGDRLVGELGIRLSLSDYWVNSGSQIFYKIRRSERNKEYGNAILSYGLKEAKKLGFKMVRINCDDKNIASKKIILNNGGIIDIASYKTKTGYSSSYIISLEWLDVFFNK